MILFECINLWVHLSFGCDSVWDRWDCTPGTRCPYRDGLVRHICNWVMSAVRLLLFWRALQAD